MKEQVTEAEKRELDREREGRRTQQPYASEMDDREIERSQKSTPPEKPAQPKVK